MKKWPIVTLLLLGAAILGATVLREPIAGAATAITAVNIVGPLDAQGNVKVRAQGVVRTQAALPVHSFSAGGDQVFEDGCGNNLPTGTRWVISSFAVTNYTDTRSGGELGLFRPGPGELAVYIQIRVPAYETRQLTFPQPFVLTSNEAGLCLRVDSLSSLVTVVGYRE
jgi:hypothetical protein